MTQPDTTPEGDYSLVGKDVGQSAGIKAPCQFAVEGKEHLGAADLDHEEGVLRQIRSLSYEGLRRQHLLGVKYKPAMGTRTVVGQRKVAYERLQPVFNVVWSELVKKVLKCIVVLIAFKCRSDRVESLMTFCVHYLLGDVDGLCFHVAVRKHRKHESHCPVCVQWCDSLVDQVADHVQLEGGQSDEMLPESMFFCIG